MSNKINRKALYSEAAKYLDIKSLFPKSKGVGRGGNLTDYQAKKIARELSDLKRAAGGSHYLQNSFVKIRRTKAAREYMETAGLPKSSRGVLLPGGEKVNSGATIRKGALFYTRGDRSQVQFPLDARSERLLVAGIREKAGYINNPENNPYIATHGGAIRGLSVDAELEGDDAVKLLAELATEVFNKYAQLAKAGADRPTSKIHGARKAAHPSRWGMSLLVEAK